MRRRPLTRTPAVLAALFLALQIPPLASQAPSERLALSALSDSLAWLTDTAPLRDRQRAIRETARLHPEAGLARLRLGLVSLRLAELGAAPDARDAVKALRGAAEERPEWPFAWYLLGLAEARRARWEREDRLALGNRVGLPTLERAASRHRRALEVDPSFAPAAVALAAVTLELRDTALLTDAVEALRRAVAAPDPSPEVLLGWGRLERAVESSDSARGAFERYLAAGGSRALALLELARSGLAAGDAEAEGAYYEGAAREDSVALAGYRADLAAVAADSELARFDRSRGTARAELLRRFWSDRDRIEMRAPGERLREHYRRLLYARRHFALTVSRRFYGPADAYRSGGMEIDDRGVIYVRHGAPTERLRPFVFGLMPNESWRFDRAEGDLLFHFSSGWDSNGGGDLYDYRLVESVLDLRGAEEAPQDQLILSRQTLSGVYGRMLNWGPYGAGRSRARERGIGQASIAIGTTTDSHELEFAETLSAVADLVAVGTAGSATIGHLVFAIAEPGTRPEQEAGGIRYAARVRAVASDRQDRPFADVDTTIEFRPSAPLRRRQYLIGRVEVPLPPGLWSWRAALQLSDSLGVVLPRDTVRVAGPGPGLTLSDLALGARGASARWEPTPQDTVLLTPFDLFLEGSEVELYYEVAGVIEGAPFRHEIAVFRIKGEPGAPERRPVVTLGFDERAAGRLLRSHRVLQLARLVPGRYLIEVQVHAADGKPVARRREFRVVRPDS
ncbi:MAG: GWxTD domain-containing protein [Gemmatimonadales bacterium]|nr:GWxTD domain-containing protein [Gemmatimonadales bacterium]